MSALTFRRALALGLVLVATGLLGVSCSSLPTFVPDLAHRPTRALALRRHALNDARIARARGVVAAARRADRRS